MQRSKGVVLGAVVLSLALLVGGCGAKQEQRSSEPASASPAAGNSAGSASTSGSAASGNSAASASTSGSAAATPAVSAPAASQPSNGKPATGKYVIVTGESKASYEVKEVFIVEALNATAIGTTTEIQGDLVLESGAFKPSKVVVDVTKLKSDQRVRDNAIKTRALETAKYNTAEFSVTAMEGGPVVEGQEVAVKLRGMAKIHGVEKELTWDGKAKLEGDTLKLTAAVEFKMDLFGIEPPNIAGKIRVDDGVKLKVDFVAKKG